MSPLRSAAAMPLPVGLGGLGLRSLRLERLAEQLPGRRIAGIVRHRDAQVLGGARRVAGLEVLRPQAEAQQRAVLARGEQGLESRSARIHRRFDGIMSRCHVPIDAPRPKPGGAP